MESAEWFTVEDCLRRYPRLADETHLAAWGGDRALRVLRLPQSLIPYAGRVRRRHYDLFFFVKATGGRLLAEIVLRFATVDPATRGTIPGRFVHCEDMTVHIHLVLHALTPAVPGPVDAPALRTLGIDQAKFQRVLVKAFDPLLCPLEVRILAA